ncbi:MAG: DedA family protein [Candidatus Dojkabacteria bacterium]
MASITQWTIQFVSSLGYLGVFIAMAIEAASIPLPSEIIMGIAGFLVYKGEMNLLLAGLIGALGNALGSTTMYVLGSRGGRPAIRKYGKYVHITEEKFDRTEAWFKKYGEKMVFFFQLLPIVRTFISLPLGILKVNFVKFRIYTFIGAFFWCTLLAYISSLLGPEWEKLGEYMKNFEVVLVVLVAAGIGYVIYKYFRKRKEITE